MDLAAQSPSPMPDTPADTPPAPSAAEARATRAARATALLARLREAFPRAFSDDRPPLRVGLHRELGARLPDIPPATIRTALKRWVKDARYLAGLACGPRRVDLEGRPTGERPTPDMARHALHRLGRRLGRGPGTFDPRRLHPLWAWAQEVRGRVARTNQPEVLAGDDLRRALRLLSNHPAARAKVAGGVTAVLVRPAPGGGCFHLRRKDGTEEAFSVSKCLGPDPRDHLESEGAESQGR